MTFFILLFGYENMIILINHHLSRFVGIWLQCFKIHMRSTSMITVDITGKHKNLVFPHIFYPRRSDSILESWQTIFRKPLRILFFFRLQKYSFFSKYRLLNPKIIIKSENNLSNWKSHWFLYDLQWLFPSLSCISLYSVKMKTDVPTYKILLL